MRKEEIKEMNRILVEYAKEFWRQDKDAAFMLILCIIIVILSLIFRN